MNMLQSKILATTGRNCLFIILDYKVCMFIDSQNYEDLMESQGAALTCQKLVMKLEREREL